ncbi:hypothetical protein ACROYT_G001188 [Oculina patagonica]
MIKGKRRFHRATFLWRPNLFIALLHRGKIEHANEDVEKMFLGNKCDMDDRRVVSKERGEQIAKEHGIRFLETSAKTNVNIEKAFYNLAEDILKKQLSKDNEETSQNIHVSNTQEKKNYIFV